MEQIPQIPLYAAIGGCLVTCTAYAALLSTHAGQEWTLHRTWATVVVGVLLVLLWLVTVDANAALMTLVFFVAGGAPMIARSLWLQHRQQNEYIEYLRNRTDGE